MKLNNKGFAISSIMYIILVLAVILISLILVTLSSRKLILDKLKDEVLTTIYDAPKITYRQTIKELKSEAIAYMTDNSLEKESIKVEDLGSSVDSEVLSKYKLNDKYLTAVQNADSYNVYLGKASTISNTPELPKNTIDVVDYKIYGESVQEGTPTPETPIEVESVGERTINLFNAEQFEAELRHGYILNDDGVEEYDVVSTYSTYKIPIRKGEPIFIKGWFQRYYIYDIDKNLISRSSLKGSEMSVAYTPTDDGYIGFQIKNTNWNNNKGTEQVHLGSIITDYEPYGYKIPVKVRGKNLFDKDNVSRTISNATVIEENNDVLIIQGNEGLNALANSAGQILIEMPNSYEANMTYTFSIYMTLLEAGKWDGINQILFGSSKSDYANNVKRNIGDPNSVIGIRKKYSVTFTPDYDLKTIAIRLNGGKWNIEWNTLQLEEGSEVTEYEPYVEPVTTNIYLDEPLRKIEDNIDYVSFTKEYNTIRNIKEFIHTGTEKYNYVTSSFVYGISDALGGKDFLRVLNSHYKSYPWVELYKIKSEANTQGMAYAEMLQIVDNIKFGSDVQMFKNWVLEQYNNATPMKTYYVLATPTEETHVLPKINTNLGATQISIDTSIAPSSYEFTVVQKIIEI